MTTAQPAAPATYSGSCHCGAVTFSVETALDAPATCNCSRCRRLGWVMQAIPERAMHLETGAETLRPYRFNTGAIEHLFCPDCRIEPFARGTDKTGAALYMVNVNCLEGANIDPDRITRFDGASF